LVSLSSGFEGDKDVLPDRMLFDQDIFWAIFHLDFRWECLQKGLRMLGKRLQQGRTLYLEDRHERASLDQNFEPVQGRKNIDGKHGTYVTHAKYFVELKETQTALRSEMFFATSGKKPPTVRLIWKKQIISERKS
jgi:hypothetical protein